MLDIDIPDDSHIKQYIIEKGWQDVFKDVPFSDLRSYSLEELKLFIVDPQQTVSFSRFLHPAKPTAEKPTQGIHRFSRLVNFLAILLAIFSFIFSAIFWSFRH